jgi:hypothetical protein
VKRARRLSASVRDLAIAILLQERLRQSAVNNAPLVDQRSCRTQVNSADRRGTRAPFRAKLRANPKRNAAGFDPCRSSSPFPGGVLRAHRCDDRGATVQSATDLSKIELSICKKSELSPHRTLNGSRSRRQCVPTAIKRIPELQTKRKGPDHHVKAFAVTYSGSIE